MMFIPGCPCCCAECTAECDTTPDANFATVYQANDTDGTLQWTGDAMGPIDGPYPGFEGSGPFSQTITLAENFSVTMPGTRFPCYARIKFWRNVGGGEGSETVTSSVTITCNSGKVDIGPVVLSEGESAYFGPDPEVSGATYRLLSLDAIPLVSGGDDQSLAVIASPIYGGTAECSPSSISVTATLAWSNAAIQHNLYGAFVECFDEIPECTHQCDGTTTSLPPEIYLTISNFSATAVVNEANDVDGTYTLQQMGTEATPFRVCLRYREDDLPGPLGLAEAGGVQWSFLGSLYMQFGLSVTAANNPYNRPASGMTFVNVDLGLGTDEEWADFLACGTGNPLAGSVSGWTARVYQTGGPASQAPDITFAISFDWELST